MSDEVNYVANWGDEPTKCKNCKQFQSQNGKTACVPAEMTFTDALAAYGECSPDGHCNHFEQK